MQSNLASVGSRDWAAAAESWLLYCTRSYLRLGDRDRGRAGANSDPAGPRNPTLTLSLASLSLSPSHLGASLWRKALGSPESKPLHPSYVSSSSRTFLPLAPNPLISSSGLVLLPSPRLHTCMLPTVVRHCLDHLLHRTTPSHASASTRQPAIRCYCLGPTRALPLAASIPATAALTRRLLPSMITHCIRSIHRMTEHTAA